jgi:hypothetical protein
MLSLNKRSRETNEKCYEKKTRSSYDHLKMKYAACKIEMERLDELQVARTTKEELGAIVQGIICESGNEEDCDANDFTSGRASYQAIKTKQILMEANRSLVTKEKTCLEAFAVNGILVTTCSTWMETGKSDDV